ncbi:MAG TPA: hypothetical protein VJ761_16665 [Ktedonobacteraceae bacterium]|nr:hypothetical protein [Ktedonobacteraceae bacterium]
MESTEILDRIKIEGDAPHGWIIFQLSRRKVITGIIGWIFGVIVGLGLFALMASLTIPHNYQNGTISAIVTTILLGIMLYIGLGSLWAIIVDARRLSRADKHVIVITPEDFVKQEGAKIIHVPLMYVRHVTARGARPPEPERTNRGNTIRDMPGLGEHLGSMFLGRRNVSSSGGGVRRKRMRTPTTLAFIDDRDESEVIVVTDTSFGDPYMIAALLKQYAASVQQIA